jgi:hypothetical protein
MNDVLNALFVAFLVGVAGAAVGGGIYMLIFEPLSSGQLRWPSLSWIKETALKGIVAITFAFVVGASLGAAASMELPTWTAFVAGFLSCASIWTLAEWWRKHHET